ncbi:hypothetical protein C5167_021024 [Papaver somniferum]|uniref:Protein EARLY FLOWERING 4 domain-containing protein n=1 Tax=Papaver somniferum TaxID=3469 RepID=A0A4Y7IWS8_PAPSO|nr:protein ELF4-LIKE 3-like [Papaver somniferum]RZC52606.1 hypothetical protein C5167_021024 [Papaver somniferum]
MEGGRDSILSGLGGGGGGEENNNNNNKVIATFQKSFIQVQNILDQNRLLINEINANHESKLPHNLSRNVGLIRELNNNIRTVVHLYDQLSTSFAKSMEVSSQEADSAATTSNNASKSSQSGQKRIRPG